MTDEREIESVIGSLLGNAGLHLLEFSCSRHGGNAKVKAVVYSPTGTGTDECVKAYRLILPQIQIAYAIQNPEIEISSPGIDRVIRSEREWVAFVGKSVKVLLKDHDEWFSGVLTSCADGRVQIVTRGETLDLEIASIAKARLDSLHKGE